MPPYHEHQPTCVLIVAAFAFFLISCKSPTPAPTRINEERFISVYCSLLKNAQRMRNWGQDPRTASLYADTVLARGGITPEDFNETVLWYNSDVRRWKSFSESVVKELEKPDSVIVPPPSR